MLVYGEERTKAIMMPSRLMINMRLSMTVSTVFTVQMLAEYEVRVECQQCVT